MTLPKTLADLAHAEGVLVYWEDAYLDEVTKALACTSELDSPAYYRSQINVPPRACKETFWFLARLYRRLTT